MAGWYGPGEMAKRLGVSVKALRVYERAGLVTPDRTAAGYRVYGPAHAARLHQVLALKRLGLSLMEIARLLDGRFASLEAVLALQQRVLEARAAEARRGLALVAAARTTLAKEGALSPDDLARLTRETTMTDERHRAMEAALRPHVEQQFGAAERERLLAEAPPFDQQQVSREWDALIAEAKALMEEGDPTTPAAQDLARRWFAQVDRFTRGDPQLFAKVGAAWQGAMADPKAAPDLPMTPELMRFVGEAKRAADANAG
jgi:DNA-binding transcriptional MerR regulator